MCARFWLRACGGAFRGSSHPGEPSRRLAPRSSGPRTSPPHLPFQSRVRSHLWAQSWCWARGVPASCGLFLSSSAKSVNFCPLYSGPMVCRRGEFKKVPVSLAPHSQYLRAHKGEGRVRTCGTASRTTREPHETVASVMNGWSAFLSWRITLPAIRSPEATNSY